MIVCWIYDYPQIPSELFYKGDSITVTAAGDTRPIVRKLRHIQQHIVEDRDLRNVVALSERYMAPTVESVDREFIMACD